MRHRHSRSGYTLLECLMYGLVLASIVNLCTALFLSARRVHALAELSVTRMDALRDIEADFREAARRSDTVVDGVVGLKVPNVMLALSGPAQDGAKTFAVWRTGDNGALIHETYEVRDGKPAITGQHGYPIQVASATATTADSGGNLVQFSVAIDNEGTPNTVPHTNTFIARLAGGARR